MAVVLLVAPLSLANAESLGSWTSDDKLLCAQRRVLHRSLFATVYCVGGFGGGGSSHNQVDYATLGASGIGTWTSTTAYPTAIDSASCVNATGGIYCVGGEDGGTVLDDVYFALGVLFGSRVPGPARPRTRTLWRRSPAWRIRDTSTASEGSTTTGTRPARHTTPRSPPD